jgi:hypothetical protein
MFGDRRGQEAVSEFMAVIVRVLVVAGITDLLRLQVARQHLEQVAYEAALRGVSRGRDWGYAGSTGMMRLSSGTAYVEAQSYMTTEMAHLGLTGYTYQIQVLPNPTGGTQPNLRPRAVHLSWPSPLSPAGRCPTSAPMDRTGMWRMGANVVPPTSPRPRRARRRSSQPCGLSRHPDMPAPTSPPRARGCPRTPGRKGV